MNFFLICAWAGAHRRARDLDASVNYSTLEGHEEYCEAINECGYLADEIHAIPALIQRQTE